MTNRARQSVRHPSGRRISCALGAMLALAATTTTLCTGCSDEVSDEFRAAASASIKNGLGAIFDGLLEGGFAVATPDSTDDTSD